MCENMTALRLFLYLIIIMNENKTVNVAEYL